MVAETSYPGSRIVNRLSGYPILNDSFNQASSYYSWAKDSSRLVSGPLNLAESGVKVVAGKAKPIASRFDDKIAYVEDIACSRLEQFETQYPVVLKPTGELVAETKEYYETNVQPLVKWTIEPINAGINGVRTYGHDTMQTVAMFGTDGLSRFSKTNAGQKSMHLLDQVLDAAEIYTDRYLASEDEKETEESSNAPESDENILKKATHLTNKVRRRMRAKAIRELANVRVRSAEAVQKLHFTVDLMEYAREHLDGAKGHVTELTDEFSTTLNTIKEQEKTEEEKTADENKAEKTESQLINVARNYANTVRLTCLATSIVFYNHISEENQNRLVKAKTFSEDLYTQLLKVRTEKMSDLSQTFFVHSREVLKFIEETLTKSFDYVSKIELVKQMLGKVKQAEKSSTKTTEEVPAQE